MRDADVDATGAANGSAASDGAAPGPGSAATDVDITDLLAAVQESDRAAAGRLAKRLWALVRTSPF